MCRVFTKEPIAAFRSVPIMFSCLCKLKRKRSNSKRVTRKKISSPSPLHEATMVIEWEAHLANTPQTETAHQQPLAESEQGGTNSRPAFIG